MVLSIYVSHSRNAVASFICSSSCWQAVSKDCYMSIFRKVARVCGNKLFHFLIESLFFGEIVVSVVGFVFLLFVSRHQVIDFSPPSSLKHHSLHFSARHIELHKARHGICFRLQLVVQNQPCFFDLLLFNFKRSVLLHGLFACLFNSANLKKLIVIQEIEGCIGGILKNHAFQTFLFVEYGSSEGRSAAVVLECDWLYDFSLGVDVFSVKSQECIVGYIFVF